MLKAMAWLNVMQSGNGPTRGQKIFNSGRGGTARPPAGLYGKRETARSFLAAGICQACFFQLNRIAALLLAALHTRG